MHLDVNLLYQTIGIMIGLATFYGLCTKPIKDSINKLDKTLDKALEDIRDTREDVVRIEQMAKSAHHRIDGLEGRKYERMD